MLQELPQAESHRAVPLFDAPHLALVARAIACGNGPGRFWTDDPAKPRAALLWDQGRRLYLAGEPTAASAADIRRVIEQDVLPHARAGAISRYEAHVSNEALAPLWGEILPGGTWRPRVLLAYRAAAAPDVPESPDPALRLRPIDGTLLQDDSLEHVEDVQNEVAGMWGSVGAFLQGGFGYCMAGQRQIACWCTAEYASPGWCGIGIETILAYQGRSLATITAAGFVRHCLDEGIEAHSDSWVSNVPSVRVARKVGFETVEEFKVCCGRLADA